MDTCDINDLTMCLNDIAFDGMIKTGIMVYWGDEFNPRTPDYDTVMIKTLIGEVHGLKLVDTADKIIFTLNNCEISMDWDVDYHCYESWFVFEFIDYCDDKKQPTIYKNRWFADE